MKMTLTTSTDLTRTMYNRHKRYKKVPEAPEEAFAQALKTAFNILGYKDNTLYQLKEKLNDRGYSSETVDAVCSYMEDKGFINDERMMYRLAHSLANSKLYGKVRIKQELSRRHFTLETLASFSFDNEELEDVDFVCSCLRLIKKKGGARDERTYALLRRYGHSPSDIKKAYLLLDREADGEAECDK